MATRKVASHEQNGVSEVSGEKWDELIKTVAAATSETVEEVRRRTRTPTAEKREQLNAADTPAGWWATKRRIDRIHRRTLRSVREMAGRTARRYVPRSRPMRQRAQRSRRITRTSTASRGSPARSTDDDPSEPVGRAPVGGWRR
jgi:hypothetical protein